MEKIKIKESIDINFYDIDGFTISQAIEWLQEKEQILIDKGVVDSKLDISFSAYYDSVDNNSTLIGEREETDNEYLTRKY